MAAVNPLQNLPVLPPTPAAPAKHQAEPEAVKAAPVQPKTGRPAAPVARAAKVQAPPPKFKVNDDKPFLPSPPSIGEKARAARGKAVEPRPRINIVG